MKLKVQFDLGSEAKEFNIRAANGWRLLLESEAMVLTPLVNERGQPVTERPPFEEIEIFPIPPDPDLTAEFPDEARDQYELHTAWAKHHGQQPLTPQQHKRRANSLEVKAAAIFAAYPRRVGGRAARQPIKRALQTEPFDKLLKATQQFATAWVGALPGEQRYCPHPARWFSEERYADDPATWGPSTSTAPPVTGSLPQQIRNLEMLVAETESRLKDSEGDDPAYRQGLKKRLADRKRALTALRLKLADAGSQT